MQDIRVDRIEIDIRPVSDCTVWIFVIAHGRGAQGLGEATLSGRESDIRRALETLSRRLLPGTIDIAAIAGMAPDPGTPDDRAWHAALAGFETAVLDLAARQAGVPLYRLLAPDAPGPRIEYYANINRGTTDRSPAGWRARAREAVAAGFGRLKMAPFSTPRKLGQFSRRPLDAEGLRHGIAAVEAVTDEIGDRARLLVDCHSQLGGHDDALEAVIACKPDWIEEPVPIDDATPQEVAALRARLNAQGVRLAGLESHYRLAGFQPWLDAGAYDAVMPDIRLCGGPLEALRILELARDRGAEGSLHNPSGPVLNAASSHVAAASGVPALLELQFRETPLFDSTVHRAPGGGGGDPAALSQGPHCLNVAAPGLGLTLAEPVPATATQD